MCPLGSWTPTPCSAGWYSNETGLSECKTCPAGFYCDPSVSTVVPLACPQGYYCPAGTALNWQACPVGTFGGRTNLNSVSECEVCNAGSYCSRAGLTHPNGVCAAGYFCPVGSQNGFGLTSLAEKHVCPTGSFCPVASPYPSPCPPGTYNPSRGKHNVTECLDCSPGSFCGLYNLTMPSGACDAGFYCTKGSNTSSPGSMFFNPFTGRLVGGGVCPTGHYCPRGTVVPYPCGAGTYNNLVEQAKCRQCPPSYFCPGGVVDYSVGQYDCPVGYYCPNGTEVATEYPCPAGTYNNHTLRRSVQDCVPSPPGHFSAGVGNAEPTGLCSTGFYCPKGAASATPVCATKYCQSGGACVAGQECPAGSSIPLACRAGHYCVDGSGLVTGPCSAGYYCVLVSGCHESIDPPVLVCDLCVVVVYCVVHDL